MATVAKPDSDDNRKNDKSILTDEWFHFDREGEYFMRNGSEEVDRWLWAG